MKTNNAIRLDKVLEKLSEMNELELTRKELINLTKRPILTNSDLTILFNISRKTAWRWRRNNTIPYITISNRYFYRWDDVLILLKQHLSKKKNS
jgi:hypothetical protein